MRAPAGCAGLLLHWGMRTDPGHTSCAEWEKAVTDGGWTPGYWVDEARKLHASYIVLASFHSRLGYSRAWPSRIPGSGSTARDFLGELIGAAGPQGLRVLLYMTDDPQWYGEGLPAGRSWLDSAAYSEYKGRPVDLHTRPGFGEFAYDNFVEIMHHYRDLAGFWIDHENAYWERNGLYERIRAERPDMTLTFNDEDPPTEDVWKVPTEGEWWYDGTDPPVDHTGTIGRIVANAGASITSLMAETAMVDGRFPPRQQAFNDFVAGRSVTV